MKQLEYTSFLNHQFYFIEGLRVWNAENVRSNITAFLPEFSVDRSRAVYDFEVSLHSITMICNWNKLFISLFVDKKGRITERMKESSFEDVNSLLLNINFIRKRENTNLNWVLWYDRSSLGKLKNPS